MVRLLIALRRFSPVLWCFFNLYICLLILNIYIMTNSHTLKKIQSEKQRELLKDHKSLITKYLRDIAKLNLKSRKRILSYYDTQITKDNIEQHYNKKIRIFLTDLLT